jgi:hypothetical protein
MTGRDLIREAFSGLIKKGGKRAPQRLGEARVKICRSCPHRGTVEPLPGLKMEGCAICGCPLSTKPFMLTRPGIENGKPAMIKITCPHPEGNKWEGLDKEFLN